MHSKLSKNTNHQKMFRCSSTTSLPVVSLGNFYTPSDITFRAPSVFFSLLILSAPLIFFSFLISFILQQSFRIIEGSTKCKCHRFFLIADGINQIWVVLSTLKAALVKSSVPQIPMLNEYLKCRKCRIFYV